MIAAVNVGNTHTAFGLQTAKGLQVLSLQTGEFSSKGESVTQLSQFLANQGVKAGITQCLVSSVVPAKTEIVLAVLEQLLGVKPKLVTAKDTGLDLSFYDSSLLGSDRLVCCYSAQKQFGAPCLVFDLGTATTANLLDENGTFLGGAILPGLTMAVQALQRRTALLHKADQLPQNSPLLGLNTAQCMQAGAVYGAVGFIEGYAKRVAETIGQMPTIVLTGGNAPFVLPYLEIQAHHNPFLLLEGLVLLAQESEELKD